MFGSLRFFGQFSVQCREEDVVSYFLMCLSIFFFGCYNVTEFLEGIMEIGDLGSWLWSILFPQGS